MSVLLIKGPPDDEVSAMMPLVTHSSPEETEVRILCLKFSLSPLTFSLMREIDTKLTTAKS